MIKGEVLDIVMEYDLLVTLACKFEDIGNINRLYVMCRNLVTLEGVAKIQKGERSVYFDTEFEIDEVRLSEGHATFVIRFTAIDADLEIFKEMFVNGRPKMFIEGSTIKETTDDDNEEEEDTREVEESALKEELECIESLKELKKTADMIDGLLEIIRLGKTFGVEGEWDEIENKLERLKELLDKTLSLGEKALNSGERSDWKEHIDSSKKFWTKLVSSLESILDVIDDEERWNDD